MNQSSVPLVFALILIVAGLGLLLWNLGSVFIWQYFWVWWPVFLIVMGLWALARAVYLQRTDQPLKRGLIAGELLFALLILAGGLVATYSYLGYLKVKDLFPPRLPLEITETKTLNVPKGATLHLQNLTGNIMISSWIQNEVNINVTRKALGSYRRSILPEVIEISTSVTGNQCEIKTIYDMKKFKFVQPSSISVDYVLTVPDDCNLKIFNRIGNVTVMRSGGNVVITNNIGNLKVNNVSDNLQLVNRVGNIQISAPGKSVTATNSTGNIKVNVTNPIAHPYNITCDRGSIELDFPRSSSVRINAQTSLGNITTNLALIVTRRMPGCTLWGSVADGKMPVNLKVDSGNIAIQGH